MCFADQVQIFLVKQSIFGLALLSSTLLSFATALTALLIVFFIFVDDETFADLGGLLERGFDESCLYMRTSLSASSSSSSSSSLESSMFAFCFLGRGSSSSPSNSSSSSLPSSASRSNKLAVVMADVYVMFCCKLSDRRYRRVDVVGRQFVTAAAVLAVGRGKE